ncbi:hypothetical protein [Aeromonas salmonicida]|uniref:Uncharacterized protein n=1 Tax=Aeromonas salmonicida TaxID=645 RepID=A0AAX1PBW7_AERSA|nr:hypothetical protein [Aeromonas salmonicida]RAI96967.1 hypothetical protein DEU50_1501 [Aeromonas salmonicida]
MRIKENTSIAILISTLSFLMMLTVGAIYLSSGWLLVSVFVVFLPLSHEIARFVTGVKIMTTIFK